MSLCQDEFDSASNSVLKVVPAHTPAPFPLYFLYSFIKPPIGFKGRFCKCCPFLIAWWKNWKVSKGLIVSDNYKIGYAQRKEIENIYNFKNYTTEHRCESKVLTTEMHLNWIHKHRDICIPDIYSFNSIYTLIPCLLYPSTTNVQAFYPQLEPNFVLLSIWTYLMTPSAYFSFQKLHYIKPNSLPCSPVLLLKMCSGFIFNTWLQICFLRYSEKIFNISGLMEEEYFFFIYTLFKVVLDSKLYKINPLGDSWSQLPRIWRPE